MEDVLRELVRPEFAAELGTIGSPEGVRRSLARSERVRQLRTAIDGGLITEAEIRRFADEAGGKFVKGEQFPYEPALAAIAVAMETRQTDFVDEFLLDLARLDCLVEFQFAPQVAAICRLRWSQLPKTKSKSEGVASTTPRPEHHRFQAFGFTAVFKPRLHYDDLETA